MKGNGLYWRIIEWVLCDGIGVVLLEVVSYYDFREFFLVVNFVYIEVGKCYGNEVISVFFFFVEVVVNC